MHRFGVAQPDERQRELIRRWGDLDKVRLVSQDLPFAVDAYDDCIADLDEQIGRLLDKLTRRGVLDRTWLIIASDHGESFGEHRGVFCHGTSLYQTELHVPLLIVPPGGRDQAGRQGNGEPAGSGRDDRRRARSASGSPFPGSSLARYWAQADARQRRLPKPWRRLYPRSSPALAINVDAYGLPMKTWPLGALNDGEWSYIRSEGTSARSCSTWQDSKEERNLARDPASRPCSSGCAKHCAAHGRTPRPRTVQSLRIPTCEFKILIDRNLGAGFGPLHTVFMRN